MLCYVILGVVRLVHLIHISPVSPVRLAGSRAVNLEHLAELSEAGTQMEPQPASPPPSSEQRRETLQTISMLYQAPCPPPFRGHADLESVLRRADEPLGNHSWVVNLGARWSGADRVNLDYAWELVKHGPPRLSTVAFEGDPAQCARLERAKQARFGGAARVQLRCEFVRARSVADKLRAAGVPANFALLKIDIDSADLPVAEAVAARLRPQLVFVEHNSHTPLPMQLAALEADEGEPLRPSYRASTGAPHAGYHGTNRVFGCFGASLAAWDDFARRFGYEIAATRLNNALLVRADIAQRARARLPPARRSSTSVWCHASETHSQNSRLGMRRPPGIPPADALGRLRKPAGLQPHQQWRDADGGQFNYTEAFRRIGRSCAEAQTPFRLRVPGVCCPDAAQQAPMRMTGRDRVAPLCRGCESRPTPAPWPFQPRSTDLDRARRRWQWQRQFEISDFLK